MLGPHYRPQLTSVLSILHRATGVVLSLVGIPLLLWLLIAAGRGAEAYNAMAECLSGVLGSLALVACVFSLSFHFFNGIRHLVWDTGRWLDLENAYRSGWAVVVASLASTGLLIGALL